MKTVLKFLADITGISWLLPVLKKAIDIEVYTGVGRSNMQLMLWLFFIFIGVLFTGLSIGGEKGQNKFTLHLGEPLPLSRILVLLVIFIFCGAGCLMLVYKADQKGVFSASDYKAKKKKR